MSDTQTARGRKEWMPNRMFDPVSNPFAIQNLLEKKVETFVEQRDELSDHGFAFDPVVMANPVHAFSEEVIDDPAAGDMQEFQAEWMDAGNEFASDTQPATGFSAKGDEATDKGMGADVVAESDNQPSSMHAGPGEPVNATADAEATTVAEALANDTTEPLEEAADALATASLTEESAGQLAGADAEAEAAKGTAAVAAADDVANTAANAAAEAAKGVTAEATADAAADTAADTVADAAPATSDAVAAPAAVSSGISEDELNARLDAAREAGRAEVREAVRAEAHQQGYDEGEAAGYAKAREELGKEYDDKLAQLQSVIDALQALSYNPDALFEPMKKLSIHLAEQLVRGELTQSPQAISRLVDNCLRELNASGEKAVIIHLHPEDVEHYKPQAAMFGDAMVLRADPKLERGSVRASLEGSVVEDLIQRRVAGLKKGLMQAPAQSWRANAGRLSDRITDGQRSGQPVDDVTIAAPKQTVNKADTVRADAALETVSESSTGGLANTGNTANTANTANADGRDTADGTDA